MWFLLSDRKNNVWTKPTTNCFTTLREILYYQECLNDFVCNAIFTIDIVVGSEYSQGRFRSVCKLILSDINIKNLDSCVIKNAHIDCDKVT